MKTFDWKARVLPMPAHCRPGFFIDLQHNGHRERFNLHSDNRDEAAQTAKEIYCCLTANGWQETYRRYKPKKLNTKTQDEPKIIRTFGEWYAAVNEVCPTRKITHANNVRSMRMIVAAIKGINGPRTKNWHLPVDAVRLDEITPKSIQRWMAAEAAIYAHDPQRQARRKSGLNSFIRQARSLWAQKILDVIPNPPPSPFEGVRFFPRSECSDTHYVSCGNIRHIITDAHNTLGCPWGRAESIKDYRDRMQVWKIFLLALFAGLRKREIDLLLTDRINWTQGLIDMRPTKYYSAKSMSSRKPALIEPEALAELYRIHSALPSGEFFIESRFAARTDATDRDYRCREHFDILQDWLREHGIKDSKPLHALRKELGDMINQHYGIVAASARLRHADTRITEAHYVDTSRLLSSGAGALLQDSENKISNS
jgi:hypothetical protein